MALLEQLTRGIPNAGRKTLLAALSDLSEASFPDSLRLCVLDAERMDAPAQIALLDELAADPQQDLIFALNKADRITGPRTVITRTLALLRERGFRRPVVYPVCARAALLFRLPTEQIAGEELMTELGNLYFRYSPGEQSLSAFAVTREAPCCLGSREVSPEQLRIALDNTGVPALAARLKLLALPEAEIVEDAPEAPSAEAEDAACPPSPASEDAAARTQPEAEPEAGAAEAAFEAEAEAASEAEAPACPPAPAREDAAADEQPEPAPIVPEVPAPEAAEDEQPEAAAAEAVAEAPADEAPAPETAEGEQPEAAPAEAEAPVEEAPAQEEPMIALQRAADRADCAELLALARAVPEGELSEEQKEAALDMLQLAYAARQTEELEALTQGLETMALAEIQPLLDQIGAGPYTVQARAPYVRALNERYDALQAQALAELGAGIEEADAQTLAQIRRELEGTDCAEVMKTDYFRRIEARQECLDVEALDRVTAGAEEMSEKELRAVAVTLEAKNWNPKYVTAYRHRIALCREAAVIRELDQDLAGLDDMERRELLELRERIAAKELPGRYLAAPLARIDERLYRMDMLRLIALNNDFDLLDFNGIDDLRAQVGRGDYAPRARTEYLARLLERENSLIMENTDARAQLVRQLIGQYKLRMVDFTIASRSPAYEERLSAFWGGSGLEQPRDIPVFFLDNASDYAFTGERFYYKVGRDLAFIPLAEIERFQTLRQHMSLVLQVVKKGDAYLLTNAKIGRSGSERTLSFLNECLRRWNEPGIAGAPSTKPIRTRRFEPSEYTAPVAPIVPDEAMALALFRGRYNDLKLRDGYVIHAGEDGWEQRTRRLLTNFGLPENTALIWYCSTTLLGAFRDGVALGPKGLYQKEGKLPVQIIPLTEIYSISRSSKQTTVTTLRGQSYQLELPGAVYPLVEDYVRAIQLGAYLRSRGSQK